MERFGIAVAVHFKAILSYRAMAKADLKRRWEVSEAAFQRLLTWLDQGTVSHGARYLEIRDRLVRYFARRNGPAPDDLADDTLNRVARRLEETGSIDDVVPARYCYIVAKFVLLESLRRRSRQAETAPGDRLSTEPGPGTYPHVGGEEHDQPLACLERCLEQCSLPDRQLILGYYGTVPEPASVRRRRLAERLKLTPNSLAIRACRIRSRLESCVRACLQK